MENHEHQPAAEEAQEKKKISLQEAMKQKFASKNTGTAFNKSTGGPIKGNQNVKSQQAKKRTNQRSRRGV